VSTDSLLRLAPARVAFGEGDVAVDGEVGEALDEAAGLGPLDFELVEFFVFGEAKDEAGVVGGEIAAAAYFETRLL
jgi:hypothetical protein